MPAFEPDQRGEGVAIDLDQASREERRTADDVCQNHLVGTSLHSLKFHPAATSAMAPT